jgi:hypothetical protein
MNYVRRKGRDAPDEVLSLAFWGGRKKKMALSCDFKCGVVARVERDPAFAMALLEAAAVLSLAGEPDATRLPNH